jgi:hypothetical protein
MFARRLSDFFAGRTAAISVVPGNAAPAAAPFALASAAKSRLASIACRNGHGRKILYPVDDDRIAEPPADGHSRSRDDRRPPPRCQSGQAAARGEPWRAIRPVKG